VALVGADCRAVGGGGIALLAHLSDPVLEVATTRHLHVEEGVALHELVDPATQRSLIASLIDGDPGARTARQLVATAPLPRAATTLGAPRGARRRRTGHCCSDALHRMPIATAPAPPSSRAQPASSKASSSPSPERR
jgi:hypothetical protein